MMHCAVALTVLAAAWHSASAAVGVSQHARISPVQKVVELLSNLEQKVIKDGENEAKAFDDFMDFCKDGAKDKEFEITTANSEIEKLTATINKVTGDSASLAEKIGDSASSISTNEADLKAAAEVREKEVAEFTATEKELADAVGVLDRALNILQRKMSGSALLQMKLTGGDLKKLIQTLSAVVDAAAFSLQDKQKLLALVQSSNTDQDEALDGDLGAPAPDAYKSHSDDIIEVLEDLREKTMQQLEAARHDETSAKHNFELLQQSLKDQAKMDTKELEDAKAAKREAGETLAHAKINLAKTEKDLGETSSQLEGMKTECAVRASDHESRLKNREEELKALAEAKKHIQNMTGGAAGLVYSETPSLLQVSLGGGEVVSHSLRTRADLANFEVVNLVRKLAKKEGSAALAQLATRISAAMQASKRLGEDPFAKVKDLISEMIQRLQKEAGEEATHKEWCDEQMGDTKTKMDELNYDIEKYTSKIDKSRADSVTLKSEVQELQSALGAITSLQAEADALRKEEAKVFVQSKSDLELGLKGVRWAIKILRDYYVNGASLARESEEGAAMVYEPADGAGTSIIALLEVVESDFSKTLASIEEQEEEAATAYERLSMENRVSKTMKEKDIEYKAKEAESLDKTASEISSDRDSSQTELDALLEYSKEVRRTCDVTPESYESRKARRSSELAGLKEALQVLEGEAVFLQRLPRQRSAGLRGGRRVRSSSPLESR